MTYEQAISRIVELVQEVLRKDPTIEWECSNDDEIDALRTALEDVESVALQATPGMDSEKEEMIRVLSMCWEVVDDELRDEIDEVTAPYTTFLDEEGNEVTWNEYKTLREAE